MNFFFWFVTYGLLGAIGGIIVWMAVWLWSAIRQGDADGIQEEFEAKDSCCSCRESNKHK